MKTCLFFVLSFLLSASILSAQEKAWSVVLEPQGAKEEEHMKMLLDNYIPMFAHRYFEQFVENNAPSNTTLLISKGRTKEQKDGIINLFKAGEETYLNYSEGDDVAISEANWLDFKLVPYVENSGLNAEEVPYIMLQKREGFKTIAGVKCHKLHAVVAVPEDGSITLTIWYAPELPAYETLDYPFLKDLPGAALGIEFFEDDPRIGLFATQVKAIPLQANDFELPAAMEIVSLSEDSAADSRSGDSTADFPLLGGAYYFKETNESLPTYGMVGIKNALGDILFSADIFTIEALNEDCAILFNDHNKFWLINNKAELLGSSDFDLLFAVDHDLLIFKREEAYGLVDYKGKIIVDQKQMIEPLTDGFLLFKENGKCGVINHAAKVVLKPKYAEVSFTDDGNLLVLENADDVSAALLTVGEFMKYNKVK